MLPRLVHLLFKIERKDVEHSEYIVMAKFNIATRWNLGDKDPEPSKIYQK